MRVANGHPWIFGNEINNIEGAVTAGDIAEVYTHDKKFMGKGYLNPQSQIQVRLLTRDRNETIDDNFFYKKLQQAWTYRQQLGYVENCRLIFGEADYLPQLVIDKFNDYFVGRRAAGNRLAGRPQAPGRSHLQRRPRL